MANTYFDFKEFRIEQSNCANKVSTDACVFGAWMARIIKGGKVLDIGCGSGLLSLMLAQGKAKSILGLEIEPNCAKQGQENISQSKFSDKIEIFTTDARYWNGTEAFDWIISNPPFFNNTYQNTDSKKTQARQTDTLSPKDWESILIANTNDKTVISLLLSNNDVLLEYESALSTLGYVSRKIELFDHKNALCKRVILFASKKKFDIEIPERFYYKEIEGQYTQEMGDLLKGYYLYL